MDVEDIEPNADVAMEMVDSFGAQFRFGKLQDGDLASLDRLDANSMAFDGSSYHDSTTQWVRTRSTCTLMPQRPLRWD